MRVRKQQKESYSDLDSLLESIRQKHGHSIVFKGNDESLVSKPEVVSTGLLSLDLALGIGGIPFGRIIEVFGPEMCGKSNLALKCASEAQRLGLTVFFIDLEHTLDSMFAESTGVDVASDKFVVSQPEYGEQAFDLIETVLSSSIQSMIIVDSVAALLPKSEFESSLLESFQLGRQAALMSNALRKLVGFVSKSKSIVIFINQTRSKIGAFFISEDTPGGKALKFYSTIRLKLIRSKTVEYQGQKIGHVAKIRVEKNKLAPPFREVCPIILYSTGFSSILDVLDLAISEKIVAKEGTWIKYKDSSGSEISLGRGIFAVLNTLFENKDIYRTIRDDLIKHLGLENRDPDCYMDKCIKQSSSSIETKSDSFDERKIEL